MAGIDLDLHPAAGVFLDLLGPGLQHVRLRRRLGAKQMVQLERELLGMKEFCAALGYCLRGGSRSGGRDRDRTFAGRRPGRKIYAANSLQTLATKGGNRTFAAGAGVLLPAG
jgi:hypothetical protein